MNYKPHPGYESLWKVKMDFEPVDQDKPVENAPIIRELMMNFKAPEGIEILDFKVPGKNGAPEVPVRVYRNKDEKKVPMVLNIHGGGFVSGDLDNDNIRASKIAKHVGCTVVSVGYRLAPQAVFPAQLEDALAALEYAITHADSLGINPEKIGVFGTSAGGCISAGLCLYLRDHGGPKISAQVLNFPALDYLATSTSALQFYDDAPLVQGDGLSNVWKLYLGGFKGEIPSYYAVPALARDLSELPPTCMIVNEYDPLRDEGIDYARRLMSFAVPTELYSLPRVPHGFDLISAPLTDWIREAIYRTFKREFGML
ncbi:alpha/beta hydrolase [Acidaminobacter hydrogenoformans]|uniref:Acetyl esterase/lipase n=1 Tax=Acidaminobacter hydrogenoformans DSM 2784 TaxID=1120920 RepID=A0A1G5S1K3_9FIRM|nr:alpha/beta hydrolase [Acidaminobacter hydrogenoformans]SCZ80028.1 Acetyl esterase/lipase [Acidaminobacter hydrogenoformans DSM 2784]